MIVINVNGTNLGFENQLWAAADKLRGHMDAVEFYIPECIVKLLVRMIFGHQQREGWGTKVIPRLARDIRNELPEVRGFSDRNIGYMIRFAREYDSPQILQQPVAKLQSTNNEKVPQLVAKLPASSYFVTWQFAMADQLEATIRDNLEVLAYGE